MLHPYRSFQFFGEMFLMLVLIIVSNIIESVDSISRNRQDICNTLQNQFFSVYVQIQKSSNYDYRNLRDIAAPSKTAVYIDSEPEPPSESAFLLLLSSFIEVN